MLDNFLEVAYTRTKEAEDKAHLVESMRKLPNELLMKIASGEEKLAFMGHGGESWLDKFKGTPLFTQAIQLEEQQLQLDMANKQNWAAESAKRSQDDAVRDELCVKKKMLGLELAKQQETEMQHAMGETAAMEAMESAQGAEMPSAPVAAAKMAEYLGKNAGAVKRYGQLLAGGNRKIVGDGVIAPPALRFASPALRDKIVKQERRSVNIARGATAGGVLATTGAGYAATRGEKNAEKEVTASARMKLAAKQDMSGRDRMLALAAAPVVGALTGAALYGLAGVGRSAAPIGTRLLRGAGTGGALGVGAAGLIGLGHLLSKADPSGKTLETTVRLAPSAVMLYGAMQDTREEKRAAAFFMTKEAVGIKTVGQVLGRVGGRVQKAFTEGAAAAGPSHLGQLGGGVTDAAKELWKRKGIVGKSVGSYVKGNPMGAVGVGAGVLAAGYGANKLGLRLADVGKPTVQQNYY